MPFNLSQRVRVSGAGVSAIVSFVLSTDAGAEKKLINSVSIHFHSIAGHSLFLFATIFCRR